MKTRLLRVLTVLLSTLLGAGFAEIVARRTYGEGFNILVDPYEDHSYRPLLGYEQSWGERTIHFYTNSLGWKDGRPGHRVAKRPRRERVVFLGDSVTEGLGYVQAQTVSGYTARFLNAAGRSCEVLNGGRSSYSPLLEYQRLKKFLAEGYRADTVVLLHDVSDVEDEISYASRYSFSPSGEPLRFRGWNYHPFLRALYNHSALVRSLRRLPQNLHRSLAPPTAEALPEADGKPAPPLIPRAAITVRELLALSPPAYGILRYNWIAHRPSLEGWAETGLRSSFGNLLRIQRLCRAHGMRFLIVIYPVPQMLYTREDPARYAMLKRTFPRWFADREVVYGTRPVPETTGYQHRMREFCAEHGIRFVDLIPEFERIPEWQRLFIPGDVHFNDRGNRLVGLRIAAALRRPAP